MNIVYASVRVRTGYGILEKLWNFEKEIPYMEKQWNLSKTAVPMEKLWKFRFGGEKSACSLKKMGENTSGLRNVVSMFVASVITSKPSSTNLPGYSASLGRVNTC